MKKALLPLRGRLPGTRIYTERGLVNFSLCGKFSREGNVMNKNENDQTIRYVLRTCNADMISYGGFQWPEIGHVEAPDFQPTFTCGVGYTGSWTAGATGVTSTGVTPPNG
jgi:hypothetical protein